jgi:hypothetical protein
MPQHPEPVDARTGAAQLLTLAVQLREAATRADRLDVAAKADEVIALVADANNLVDGGSQSKGSDDKGNAVVRILDGLGF